MFDFVLCFLINFNVYKVLVHNKPICYINEIGWVYAYEMLQK